MAEQDNIQLGMLVDVRQAKRNIANFGQDAAKEVAKVSNELSKTSVTATGQLQPSLKQSNFQLMNMGRIVQDLPYGFMGIGNNITLMAEQMARAKTEGIGIKNQLKGMLTSLTGVGGIMFAISTVVTLITIFAMKSRESKREIKELNLEMIVAKTESELWAASIKNIREDLTKLSETDLASTITRAREQVQQLELDLDAIKEHEAWGGGFVWMLQQLGMMETSEALQQKLKETNAVVKEGEDIQKGVVDLVQKQEAAVKKIKEEEATTTAQLIDKNRRLQAAEKELNRLKDLGIEKRKKEKELVEETRIIQFRTADEYFQYLQNKETGPGPREKYWAMLKEQGKSVKEYYATVVPEMKKELSLWEDIDAEVARTGRTFISTLASSAQLLKNNNSMLQQFINLLGKAIIETLALRAAMFFLSFLGGGGPVAAVASKVAPSPAPGPSGGFNKPVGGNFSPGSFGSNRVITNTIIQPVAVTGKIIGEGRQMYVLVENERKYDAKFK